MAYHASRRACSTAFNFAISFCNQASEHQSGSCFFKLTQALEHGLGATDGDPGDTHDRPSSYSESSIKLLELHSPKRPRLSDEGGLHEVTLEAAGVPSITQPQGVAFSDALLDCQWILLGHVQFTTPPWIDV